MKLLALGAVLALASSCAGNKALLISGESLISTGAQFRATAKAFDDAYDAKLVSADAYREWKAFGLKFQVAYPAASDIWNVAVEHKDETLQQQATAQILGLVTDLTRYAALVGVKL